MSEEQKPANPWLKATKAMSEELEKQSPEVQVSQRRLSRKVYPQSGQAIREREQQE